MTIDDYVTAVVSRVPRQLVDRARVEADLRAHVADRMDAGASQEEAVRHLGHPDEVAAELLAAVRLEPASRRRRFAAFLVDCLVGALPLSLLFLLVLLPMVWGMEFWSAFPGTALAWVWGVFLIFSLTVPVMSVLYFPVLEKLYGQTIGKWALGIVVVRDTGARLRWRDAIIRRLPFLFEFFWLDALFALFTAKKQRAFDLVASTVVVRGERGPQGGPAPMPVM